jgi:putative thioredoxin
MLRKSEQVSCQLMTDVTDATFETAVLNRSQDVPVVVDLWAPWCGPCKTLGPMLERAVAATEGAVEIAKVNVDDNPQIAASFNVQSIPAVFAISQAKVVDSFIGAVPEAEINAFVQRLAPAASEADTLVALGDEASLRAALELEPGHVGAVTGLARLLIDGGDPQAALALLAKIAETPETRALSAQARLAIEGVAVAQGEVGAKLDELLEHVKEDDTARQEFVDILETLGAEDPLTAQYRKALAARLY